MVDNMHPSRTASAIVAALTLTFLPARATAEVKLPAVLSSHMVLQRDVAVPVWGTAAAGEKVTVKFRDQEKIATADKDGKWAVKLDALKAGGPDMLTVTGTNSVSLEDVLVGEVWVGSGQSNMAGNVGGYAKGDEVLAKLAAGSYPKIRLNKSGGKWQATDEKTVNSHSAILFAFGVRLQKELDVPVGLMVGAVGGTPSGYWLSDKAYRSDEECKTVVKKFAEKFDLEKAKADYAEKLVAWEKLAEQAKKDGKNPPAKPQMPVAPGESAGKIGNLYEAHIRPMMPFAIRGVLWDQGESGTAINGVDQYTLMGALIRGWRSEWAQGDFPFIYIQKPSGGGCAWDPMDPVTNQGEKFAPLPKAVPATGDGLYRELHVRIMKHPNTFMAISSDLGPGIHPTNKSGYGVRAAQVALGGVYAKKVEIYGPVYKSHKVDGDKVRVSFDHVGAGLAFRHGDKLQGFAVAGADGVFQWADAVIDGDTVVVSNSAVPKPVAVRYAFASKHTWANLFNKDGLPAVPFRSDPEGK
ncbi:MAG: sialate O-acetylesterase [Planctomycetaceae bacterium]|nr:sialate O-acetylesterase [Planctomycetaceae bacterium]